MVPERAATAAAGDIPAHVEFPQAVVTPARTLRRSARKFTPTNQASDNESGQSLPMKRRVDHLRLISKSPPVRQSLRERLAAQTAAAGRHNLPVSDDDADSNTEMCQAILQEKLSPKASEASLTSVHPGKAGKLKAIGKNKSKGNGRGKINDIPLNTTTDSDADSDAAPAPPADDDLPKDCRGLERPTTGHYAISIYKWNSLLLDVTDAYTTEDSAKLKKSKAALLDNYEAAKMQDTGEGEIALVACENCKKKRVECRVWKDENRGKGCADCKYYRRSGRNAVRGNNNNASSSAASASSSSAAATPITTAGPSAQVASTQQWSTQATAHAKSSRNFDQAADISILARNVRKTAVDITAIIEVAVEHAQTARESAEAATSQAIAAVQSASAAQHVVSRLVQQGRPTLDQNYPSVHMLLRRLTDMETAAGLTNCRLAEVTNELARERATFAAYRALNPSRGDDAPV